MTKKIVLNAKCKKSAICDREEYFKKYGEYDNQGCFKRMRPGAPLVINIGGNYYYYDKLVPYFGCTSYDDYRRELKSPYNKGLEMIFIWR